MMSERQQQYDDAAQFRVDSTRLRHDEVASLIIEEARKIFGWPQPAQA